MGTQILQHFEVRHTCEVCGLSYSQTQLAAVADTKIPEGWDYRYRFSIGNEWDPYMKSTYVFEYPERMLCCKECKEKHPTWNDLLAEGRHKERYLNVERG